MAYLVKIRHPLLQKVLYKDASGHIAPSVRFMTRLTFLPLLIMYLSIELLEFIQTLQTTPVGSRYSRVNYTENNVCTLVTNCFSAHERVILVFNKHNNNTRVGAETVCHESTYIISFLTRHNESINDDKPTIFTYRPSVSLARFLICWWRHNRLLMTSHRPGKCDAITWIVISNESDIDFIHGDIHGRVRKDNITYSVAIYGGLTHILFWCEFSSIVSYLVLAGCLLWVFWVWLIML